MIAVVEAPERIDLSAVFSVFLAGGITDCPDWQAEMIGMLGNLDDDVVLLNPRRKNFPIDDPSAAFEQIQWEYDMLRAANLILFWFAAEATQPIALYELGAWSMTEKLLCIGIHPTYERRADVEIQTLLARPEVTIAYDLNELALRVVIKVICAQIAGRLTGKQASSYCDQAQ